MPLDSRPALLGAPAGFFLLGALIFGVFGLSFWAPFIYDDTILLIRYSEVIGPWRGWWHWFSTSLLGSGEWEPLPILLNRAIYSLAGESVFAFRLFSVLLHWLCAGAFLALARRLLPPHEALAAAVLFALYPGHAEVVAVASFKKHLLVTLFGFVFLNLALARAKRLWADLAMAALFALALLSKETALALPLLLLALKAAVPQARRAAAEEARLGAMLGVVAAAYAGFRVFVVPRQVAELKGSLIAHALTAGKCLLWYLGELVAPLRLCQEHSLRPVREPVSWEALLILVGLGLAAMAARLLWRRDRLLGLSAAWIGIALLPFLNLFPYLNFSLVANRYLYLASAGLAMGVGRALSLWGPRRWLITTLGVACAALLYAVQAMAQLGRYADPLELWTQACACAPDNVRAHMALAEALRVRGRIGEAEQELATAQRLAPAGSGYAGFARLQLAETLLRVDRNDEALALALANMRVDPGTASGLAGVALMALNRHPEARPHLERARALIGKPQNAVWLGQCLYELGERAPAESLWEGVLEHPDWGSRAASLLGKLHEDGGDLEKAARYFELSLAGNILQIETTTRLANALRRLGREEDARRRFDVLVAATQTRVADATAFGGDAPAWTHQLHQAQRARAAFLSGRSVKAAKASRPRRG